jgi:nicotinate-nucleotide pyrophosphorylase (carboxylating)
MKYEFFYKDGEEVKAGDTICTVFGKAEEIIKAEEVAIGKMAKASGIATATRESVRLANGKCKIVAGAWKKMPKEIKPMIQKAVRIGGASTRLIEETFIYLDKNYIRMFGSIKNTLIAVNNISGWKKVIQLKGEESSIEEEAYTAIKYHADIIMVDTGKMEDMIAAKNVIRQCGVEENIKLGFASELLISKIPEYAQVGVDFLCFGKQIIDAPLLDMKLDVSKL